MQDRPQRAASPALPLPRATDGRSGFTLLEILLVLALVGLLSGIMITGVTRMLNPGPESPSQAFWAMASAARRYALINETEVRVSFDATTTSLVGTAGNGIPLPPVPIPGGAGLTFISGISPTAIASSNTAMGSVFGDVLGNGTDTSLSSVIFYRDGTCNPFRVTVDAGGASSTIAVDPWTAGPMLIATATGSGAEPAKGPFQ